jgi:hypothetical protein
VKLVLKPGTTVDTTGINVDAGYTAEMVIDLTKIGYPHGLGDHIVFFNIDYYDGDSFIPFTDSYGTRTWWGAEYDNTCCPAWSYMDPLMNVLTDVPGRDPGTSGYQLMSAAPNPFRTATTLHYLLAARAAWSCRCSMRRVASSCIAIWGAGSRRAACAARGLQRPHRCVPLPAAHDRPGLGRSPSLARRRLLVVR